MKFSDDTDIEKRPSREDIADRLGVSRDASQFAYSTVLINFPNI